MGFAKVRIGRALLVGTAIVAVALALIWSQRRPIAAGAIDRALAARGVQASYEIRDIGFRTQRIEKLRLGDPANPDLTADWAEVSLAPTWGGVTVTALNASGVRLHGRVVDGRVSWGAVDKLLPAPTGKPLALPDIDVRLADTRVTLATDIGAFTADVTGAGQLSSGFNGQVRATAPFAGRAVCRLESPIALTQVTITRRRPHLVGTLGASSSGCDGIATGPLRTRFEVTLGEAFDTWKGTADVAAAGLRQDALQVAQPIVRLAFSGTAADTKGSFTIASPAARYAGTRLAGLTANGTFDVGKSITADGRANVARALADPVQLASLRRAFAGAAGTPVGPLAAALSQAIGRAGDGAAVDAVFAYRDATARLSDVRVAARGGGMLTLRNGAVVIGRGGVAADADISLTGGGFPAVRGRLNRAADGTTRGLFDVAVYRAGSAQLALAPVRFAARPDGTMRVETVALLDGPLGDGRAEGIRMPLAVQRASSGDIFVAPGCTPVAWHRVAMAGTMLAPGSVTLCPTQGGALVRSTRGGFAGGARTGPLRLTGRVGDQPLALSAARASFDLGGPVSLADFAALIGTADRRTQLRIARLDGVSRASGLSGRYAGLSGNIARAPFLASAGQGNWTFAGGTLDVGGTVMLADQAETIRFNPLSARGVKLRLKDGRIAASAVLTEPVSGRAVTTVTVAHDLSRGVGEARLAVEGLTFGKLLQPEAITPLTKAIVPSVYGTIDGTGLVQWRGDKVTSSGRFRTDGLDLEAGFGTVTGASGEIEFDDLIALSTPPGQTVKLALVNPGTEVKDGVISYRLRPNQIVEIERGRWPFAGGELLLDPASLDFGSPRERRLSFRVTGLDAAKFIEQLKLENIAATGTFDGTLPIVFGTSVGGIVEGRIVGGQIIARSGGGTLAYVGDVSNAQTNAMTRLAFDALKSIRYKNLIIELDGSLDGEMVSLVRFDGVNRSPVAPSGLARSFTGLPFLFNIRVRAPFRGLVGTARDFQDPRGAIDKAVKAEASGKQP
ncbi:YdbH domain-containing protein [Sphingomonas sp. SUN039]|uniref:YdbH domain-containing protein n=1 Tax=Sphingomonas sp. SUN039 TaxID=2937787 RepID=UPI0021649139|nr:YdbH domain-containing protein [Sphingomonas sp. SUN039]UVO54024.1 YdbH domain-containing protein [Sphingomonas sp. SUN039]